MNCLVLIMVRTRYILAPVLHIFTDTIEQKRKKEKSKHPLAQIILQNFDMAPQYFCMFGSCFIFLPVFSHLNYCYGDL